MPHGRYVAVIDDDEAVRKAIATLLRAHGIESRTYASGQDLLEALSFGIPSCLVLDLNMPAMTGLELLEELARRGLSIPTIAITGSNERLRDRSRHLGALECLRKPVNCDLLIAAVHSASGL